MQSSCFSPDYMPVNVAQHRSAAVESLYPSRLQIEAIEIPDCREVWFLLQNKSSVTCRRQTSSGRTGSIHNGRQPIRSSSGHRSSPPSCQDKIVYNQAKAFPRKESDGSYGSQPGMVNVMGSPHINFDRKPSIQKYPASRLEIEVFPGVFLPLHGSQETLSAMQEGQLVSCACFVCTRTIMCVPQASYVLCPDCRVVSPVESSSVSKTMKRGASLSGEAGGVGLGMKLEEYHSLYY